jgi:hypothetical protein
VVVLQNAATLAASVGAATLLPGYAFCMQIDLQHLLETVYFD